MRLPMNPERFLSTTGIHNLRDYGGYRTADGGRVRRALLWRSGHHAEATPGDLEAVAALNLAQVVDFRGKSERVRNACRRHADFAARIHAYDGETASLAPHLEAADTALDAAGAHAAMLRIYAGLPDREPVLWVMRRYFDTLARDPGPKAGSEASLVHCHAGKDRTGMAVYLLHHLLGVHPDDAMEDYLLTNHAPNNEARIASGFDSVKEHFNAVDEETVRVLMGVDPRYIEAMKHAVETRYGSLDAFLEDELQVDADKRAALRLRLVEQ